MILLSHRNGSTYPDRQILHLDLDSFFVSVERLRDGRLNQVPLIVGGNGSRGIVTSCSYEARKFGIHAGMPTKMALKLCPAALVISGDMEAYTYYSKIVTEIIHEKAPAFEKASIDEFYIDLTGMERYHHCFQWSKELKELIVKETGLPISFGLSVNKLVSKVATGESKPNGAFEIMSGNEKSFLAPLNVRKIPMIGVKTTARLHELGVRYVKTLRSVPIKLLERSFGNQGKVLWKKANGIDNSEIKKYSERKSISSECTFISDSIDIEMMTQTLVSNTEKICRQLRESNRLASIVTIKIKYSNFQTETRQQRLPYTSSEKCIIDVATRLFTLLYTKRMMLRLIGVRISGLIHGGNQLEIFDDPTKSERLLRASDVLKCKYGHAIIRRSSTLQVPKPERLHSANPSDDYHN